MSELINWFIEFAGSILVIIGFITLFLIWSHFSDKKYENLNQADKKKIDERRGVIFGIIILIFILGVITASVSSIFF